MRGLPAPFITEAPVGLVQVKVTRHEQERYAATASVMGKSELTVVQRDSPGLLHVVIVEDGMQQANKPVADAHPLGAEVLTGVAFGIGGIQIAGDAPVTGELFLYRQ